MVIDFHVHGFPDDLAVKAVPALAACAGIPARSDGTVGQIKKSMKNAGVNRSVVLSIATKPAQTEKVNTWSAAIQDEDIIAFGSIHPEYMQWEDELKRIKSLGLKGIKFHPDYQGFFADEPRMFPIYELAIELGLMIIFHAGVDIGLPPPCHCTPERLLKVVKQCRGGTIIAAHMGGYAYWDEVEKLLVGQDIYFDTSYSIGVINELQAKRIIQNHGYQRILFATDSPWRDQKEEIEKISGLGLKTQEIQAILGENARGLLKISNSKVSDFLIGG